LAGWVPATDWNTRSTGAPCSSARSVVVTWASTQDWVGMPYRVITSSTSCSRATVRAGESVAGLMPMTASPQPCSSPSTMDAVTPSGSSVGWLGCSREASRPGRPRVLRSPVTTRVRRPTATRSALRISFEVAATISGVSPRASSLIDASSPAAAQASSRSRNSPTVSDATGAKATGSWVSRTSRVTSSSS
jgi:hypothetical protein